MPSNFLMEFFKNPMQTAALSASSPQLAELITSSSCLRTAKSVVELGPGTGVFTKRILRKIPPRCSFFAIEINPIFVEQTKQACCDATVYHDTAYNLPRYLDNSASCDCIVSSLPWSQFDGPAQDRLLSTISSSLRDGGEFHTFAYISTLLSPAGRRFRKIVGSYFSQVKTSRCIWRNLPPAFVYQCKK